MRVQNDKVPILCPILRDTRGTMSYNASVGKRIYRTKEAAHYLAVSPKTIRRLAQDGILPILQEKDGAPWRFDVTDLDRYIDQTKHVVL
jgi:excisionase family DNA binding protein